MAKLHNYYVLCPLIDQKSFLGVSEDSEEGCVIVTLGRNVVNKYRLSDQKQLGGWTSRDHLTAPVVYDHENDQYVGIFNNNTIKIWKDDDDNLDKVKKYKFSVNMLKIIPRGVQTSLILFSNGNCASFPYAIDNRKTYESKSLIRDSEVIVDMACYTLNKTDYICYIVKNSKDCYEIINCPVRVELGDLERSKLIKIKVSRPDDVSVVGELINTDDKSLGVYILWTDSKITMYDFNKKSWKTIGTVPWMSMLSNVSMAWMGKNHLILFGHNLEQDGAVIIAYNVVLGVASCRYPMKMHSEDAKLYCFNSRIILEASNHIGMLPYVLETKRNLSSLLGSHEIVQDENMVIADWDTPITPQFVIPDDIKDHLKIGSAERSICAQVIPPLLEKNNVKRVLSVIKEFKDVPESVLVHLLNYTIKVINPNKIDVTNQEEFIKLFQENQIAQPDKLALLNYIFQITFSDALLIPCLRNGLALDDTLFIMQYLTHLLQYSELAVEADYESKLLDWCILLMDAFYQQYLMTKDERVTYVLKNTLNIVVNLVKELHAINGTMIALHTFLTGKPTENKESVPYAIEMMQI